MRLTRYAGSVPALLAVAATSAGMALAAPASAGPVSRTPSRPAAVVRPAGPRPLAKDARAAAATRRSERRLAARHASRPSFAAAAATVFTVNGRADSDLATAGGTTCKDVYNDKCSLRAAVDAANNLGTPVRIVLPKGNYALTSGTELTVTNPAGTSITGAGASTTTITGAGSGLFDVTTASGASAGVLFLSGTTLTNGTGTANGAGTEGGAIYLDDTNSGSGLVLDDDVITGNTASTGGGIYSADGATIYATDTTITHNTAGSGAGIYEYWSDVHLVDTDVTQNTTSSGVTGSGAGLYDYYGVVTVSKGSISGNTAGDATAVGYGGGIYDYYALLTLDGVSAQHDTATYGGALYAYYDTVEATGGSMSHDTAVSATDTNNNTSDASGGAVYASYGVNLALHHTNLADDSVSGAVPEGYGGGAIYDYAYDYGNQVTIDSGSTITGSGQSAVYVYAEYGNADIAIDDSTLSTDSDTAANGYSGYGCGGAVCAYAYEYGSIALSMNGDTVTANTSAGNQGAGAISMYSYEYAQTTASLDGTAFTHNSTGAGGYGGAVSVSSEGSDAPQSVRLTSDRFTGNTAGTSDAEGYGGALAVYGSAALGDQGSTFSGNAAVGDGAYGGAVYDASGQTSTFDRTVFTGNSVGKGAASGYGGALYTDDATGNRFTGVRVSGNKAASAGGGIYGDEDAYELGFTASTLSGNTAGSSTVPGTGGGLYAADGVVTFENSTVSGNAASGTSGVGGGIWQGGSRLGLRYTTVSGNTAATAGGVYTAEGFGGSLLGSIVSHNLTATGGSESDCASTNPGTRLSSLGGNVLGKKACVAGVQPNDVVTAKAGLGALANNGGPTKTMQPQPSSPALNRSTESCPATDQRGEPRPSGACDAGSYQRAVASVTKVSPSKGKAGQSVTITGSGFTFATKVTFGSKVAGFTVISDTKIRAVAPKGLKGTVTVTITSRDGSAKTGTFKYVA